MPTQMMKTEIFGMKELKDYVKELGDKGEIEYRREVKTTALRIKNDYRRKVKKHHNTGKLYNSIVADTNDGWESAEVGTPVLHGLFLEVGTKAHPIPKIGPLEKNKFLVFFWEKVGGTVFAKRVNHPGTRANPYLLQAFIKNSESFAARLTARLDKIK